MSNTTPNYGFPTPDGNAIAEFDTQNIVAGMVDTELHNVSVNTAQARTDAQEALTRSIAANDASIAAGAQAASAITTAQGAQNTATSAATIAQGAKNTADSAIASTTLLNAQFDYYKFQPPANPSYSNYMVYVKVNKALGIMNIFGTCTSTNSITTGQIIVDLSPLLTRLGWNMQWVQFYSGAFTSNPAKQWANVSFIPLYVTEGVLKTNTTPPADDKSILFSLAYYKENTPAPVLL